MLLQKYRRRGLMKHSQLERLFVSHQRVSSCPDRGVSSGRSGEPLGKCGQLLGNLWVALKIYIEGSSWEGLLGSSAVKFREILQRSLTPFPGPTKFASNHRDHLERHNLVGPFLTAKKYGASLRRSRNTERDHHFQILPVKGTPWSIACLRLAFAV